MIRFNASRKKEDHKKKINKTEECVNPNRDINRVHN